MPETVSKSDDLNKNETIELTFRPNVGRVSVKVNASWDRILPPDPTKHQLELFVPDQDDPIATDTTGMLSSGTRISVDVTESNLEADGQWRARVTNLEKGQDTQLFELTVTYPGETAVLTAETDAFDIERRLNDIFQTGAIRLTSGHDRSFVRLLHEYGIDDHRFTIPELEKTIPVSSTDTSPYETHTVSERLYDMSADGTRATLLDRGQIRVTFVFEDENYELVGDVDVHLRFPRAYADLQLSVVDGTLAYGNVTGTFDFEHDIEPFRLESDYLKLVNAAVVTYADDLQSEVGRELARAFQNETVRTKVVDIIADEINEVLPEDAQLYKLGRVMHGILEVKYISKNSE